MKTTRDLVLLLSVAAFARGTGAQALWQDHDTTKSGRLEVAAPAFQSGSYMGSHGGLRLQVGARLPVSGHTLMVFDLPMASSSDPTGFMESKISYEAGCPYIGFEFVGHGRSHFSLETGLRFPLGVPSHGRCFVVGNAADPERLGAFPLRGRRIWTLSTALNYEHRDSHHVLVGGRIGLAVMIPSDVSLSFWSDDWPEVAAEYGYRLGLETGRTTVQAGFSGFAMIAEEFRYTTSRFHNFVRWSVALSLGRVVPELYVSKQLASSSERYLGTSADYTIGLSFTAR